MIVAYLKTEFKGTIKKIEQFFGFFSKSIRSQCKTYHYINFLKFTRHGDINQLMIGFIKENNVCRYLMG